MTDFNKYYNDFRLFNARLQLYPTGVRIYRCSRGIKRPQVEKMEHYQAMKEVQRSKAYF